MIGKKHILVALLTFASFTTHFVQAKAADLCTDPVKAVCEDSSDKNQDLKVKMSALKIREEAAQQIIRYLDFIKMTSAQFVGGLNAGLHGEVKGGVSDDMILAGYLYVACVDYLSRGYFSGVRSGLICFPGRYDSKHPESLHSFIETLKYQNSFEKSKMMFAEVKAKILEVVDRSHAVPTVKANLREHVLETKQVNTLDYVSNALDSMQTTKEDRNLVLGELLSSCDLGLESLNAFNYPVQQHNFISKLRVSNSLVTCPSVWLTASAGNSDEAATQVFMVLAHEMGHTIQMEVERQGMSHPEMVFFGSPSESAIYQRVLACMDRKYVSTQKLHLVYPEAISPKLFRRAANFIPEENIAAMFSAEFSADTLSAQALSIYLTRFRSVEARKSHLARGLNIFCSDRSDESVHALNLNSNTLHPSGAFRIKESFLSNPALRRTLGCNLDVAEESCSIL